MLIGWPSSCSCRWRSTGIGAAGQRRVEVGVADVGQSRCGRRPRCLPRPPPRREDRLAHLAGLDGLGGQEAHPGLGQPLAVGQIGGPDARLRDHSASVLGLPVPGLEAQPAGGVSGFRLVTYQDTRGRSRPLSQIETGGRRVLRGDLGEARTGVLPRAADDNRSCLMDQPRRDLQPVEHRQPGLPPPGREGPAPGPGRRRGSRAACGRAAARARHRAGRRGQSAGRRDVRDHLAELRRCFGDR